MQLPFPPQQKCPVHVPGDEASYQRLMDWRRSTMGKQRIPNDYLRLLFINCLLGLDEKDCAEICLAFATVLDCPVDRLVKALYRNRSAPGLDLEMYHRIYEAFEERLTRPSYRNLQIFLTEHSEITLLGICCPLARMLGLVSSHLSDFFDDETDPRLTVNTILAEYSESRLPGSIMRIQSETNIRGDVRVKSMYAPDPSYGIPTWFDINLYEKRSAMANSTWFGLHAAYDFKVRYDCRPMEYVLRGLEWKSARGMVSLDGRTIGIIEDFSSLPADDPILPELPAAKRWVVLAICDVFCPHSGRLLWRQNTVYGTPYYFYELSYPPLRPEEKGFFKVNLLAKTSAISSGIIPVRQNGDIGKKFLALQSLVAMKVEVFQYSESSDHLYLGTGRFARGSVARLLVAMLREHTRSGQTEFPFLALKYDRFITSNPKSSGFETYVKRLQSRLQLASKNVRLNSTDRGTASLEVCGPVRLETI